MTEENQLGEDAEEALEKSVWLGAVIGFLIAFFVGGLVAAGIMAYGSTLSWTAVLVVATVCGGLNVATRGRLWAWLGIFIGSC